MEQYLRFIFNEEKVFAKIVLKVADNFFMRRITS